jgi:hypothetical protein
MSPVINLSDPGRRRNEARRTIAEILRHLMLKRELDAEAKDMASALVFNLREVAQTIQTSVAAWEKRNYYLKADRFYLEWEWVEPTAQRLRELILHDHWDHLPRELAQLATRFGDVRITRLTRDASAWDSSYDRLVRDNPDRLPGDHA